MAGQKKMLEEIMPEIFPNLVSAIYLHEQVSGRTMSISNMKKTIARHIIHQLLKIINKEKNLKNIKNSQRKEDTSCTQEQK
jgi:hypothetical protein